MEEIPSDGSGSVRERGILRLRAASLRETVTPLRMTGSHHQALVTSLPKKKVSNKKPCRLHDKVSKESGSRIGGRIRHSACGGLFSLRVLPVARGPREDCDVSRNALLLELGKSTLNTKVTVW